MCKFDDFIKTLFESYDNPVDIKCVDKNNKLIGLFIVDKIECTSLLKTTPTTGTTIINIYYMDMYENVDLIIEALIETTKLFETIWLEKKSNISNTNRNFERLMFVISNGTTFNIKIKYIIIDNCFVLEKEPSLFIFNKELPGGSFCSSSKSVISLRDTINDMFCQDMIPQKKDLDDVLESIRKDISLSMYRDNKLGGLLD